MVPLRLTHQNFELVTAEKNKPVLVEFWSEQNESCRPMHKVVNRIAYELEGKAVTARLNVDECPAIAQQFHVDVLPAFAVFRYGKLRSQAVGKLPKDDLIELVLGKSS